MKLVNRLLIAGSLVSLVAGIFLAPVPAVYAEGKKTAAVQEKQQGYVASNEGEKYHTASCRMTKKIKAENKVVYSSTAEAEKDGKTPCGICKP